MLSNCYPRFFGTSSTAANDRRPWGGEMLKIVGKLIGTAL
jgi:hypothetical protein